MAKKGLFRLPRLGLCLRLVLSAQMVTVVVPATMASVSSKVTVEPPLVDFGLISPETDGTVNRTLTIANAGSKPLRIDYLGATCGCTEVEAFDHQIDPGASRTVTVTLRADRAGGHGGLQRLLFATDDPENPQIAVDVAWSIRRPVLELSPSTLELELLAKDVRDASPRCANLIFLTDNWEKRLEIGEIQTSTHVQSCLYDMLYRCPSGGQVHILKFKTRLLPTLPVGPINEWIRFSTNHPEYPEITVPITGQVVAPVRVVPKMLIYRDVSPASPSPERTLYIEATEDGDKVVLQSVIGGEPWIKAHPRTTGGRKVELAVSLDRSSLVGAESVKMFKTNVRIQLSEPAAVELTVDVIVLLK